MKRLDPKRLRAEHFSLLLGVISSCVAYDRTAYLNALDAPVDVTMDATADSAVLDAGIDSDASPASDVPLSEVVDATVADVTADITPDACAVVPSAPDPCSAIPALTQAPVIDGTLECGLGLYVMPMIGWSGASPMPPTTTSIALAYRPDGLYVFVSVRKGPGLYPESTGNAALVYCGDAVEIFVDSDGVFTSPPAYDTIGTRQFVVTSPSDTMPISTRASQRSGTTTLATWLSPPAIAVARPDGYDVEAFIAATDMGLAHWSLAAGQQIGFDLAIDLGRPPIGTSSCPGRLGQYYEKRAPADSGVRIDPASNTYAFCVSTLSP